MDGGLPRAESTLAIVLGASEFPKAGELSPSPSFKRSAEAFRDYLVDKEGLGLRSSHLLYLFDSSRSGSDLDEEVAQFLQAHVNGIDGGEPATDVILYYVGHGGFGPSGADYYLALRTTRLDNPVISSYSVQSLASTLKRYATHLRRYVILDSCFSAAAYSEFQSSGPLEVAVQQTKAVLPLKGTALLCASGPRNPAKAPQDAQFTMFSGAMIQALRDGVDQDFLHYSFEQLAETVEKRIWDTYPDAAVRPEVHFPNQPDGVIGRLPLFPNPQRSTRAVQRRLDALEPGVAALKQGLAELRGQNASIATALREVRSEIDAMSKRVGAEHGAPRPGTTDDSPERQIGGHRIRESEWKQLPGEIKAMMLQAHRARQHGVAWFAICFCAAAASLAATFSPFVGTFVLRIAVLVVALLSLINLSGVVRDMTRNLLVAHSSSSAASGDWWDDVEAVVALRTVHTVAVFPGFRITGTMLYSSTLACAIGFIASFAGYVDADLFRRGAAGVAQ